MTYIDFEKGVVSGLYPINLGKTRIGREQSSDIVVEDKEHKVSRKHMDIIATKDGELFVLDLGSKNGTYVNKKLIGQRDKNNQPYKLKDGDIITFGSYEQPETFKVCLQEIDYHELGDETVGDGTKKEDDKAKESKKTFANKTPVFDIESRMDYVRDLNEGYFGKTMLMKDEHGNNFVVKYSKHKNEVQELRFRRECRNVLQLRHPNILKTYIYKPTKIEDKNSEKCLVMEYAEEGTLKEYIDSNGGRLGILESIEITLQILEGLNYLDNVGLITEIKNGGIVYTRGITHRDISPQNIFSFNNHTWFKIGDFGLSKARVEVNRTDDSYKTQPNERIGKIGFASKLQYYNYADALGFLDLWSCIATLFYMLTGGYPRTSVEDFSQKPNRVEVVGKKVFQEYKKKIKPESVDKLIDFINEILLEEDKEPSEKCGEIQYTTAADAEEKLISIYKEIKSQLINN